MFRVLLAAALSLAPAPAGLDAASLAELRRVDLRLGTIAWRLQTANAALCRELTPAPGFVLHALTQYDADTRPAARGYFGFTTPVAVEAVVSGSPAERAGIRADDGIATIAGNAVTGSDSAGATSADRDAALRSIAAQPADRPLALGTSRGGATRDVTVAAQPGCRVTFEVLLGPNLTAESDGDTVQIGVRYFERYADEQVAVVVAHELAHAILKHRVRLDAAGVKRGLLAEVGRNARLFQQTETEADLLGVHLLHNAGYDPASAPAFWRSVSGSIDGGLFRSRTHPASKKRAEAVEAEIARIPADAPRPYLPPILTQRDQSLR